MEQLVEAGITDMTGTGPSGSVATKLTTALPSVDGTKVSVTDSVGDELPFRSDSSPSTLARNLVSQRKGV